MAHATREYCPVMNDLAVYERQVAIDEIHAEQVQEKFDDLIEQVMQKPIEEMQELYNNREIEK